MRNKNVLRAAHGLYLSQADDKNKLLSKFCSTPEAKELVQDQGRALVLLEKLILPQGKNSYTEEYMSELLLKKLKKKGHRIQEDDEEDDVQYAKEKAEWEEDRLAEVPTLFGKSIKDEKKDETPKPKVEMPKPKSELKTPWFSLTFYVNCVRFYLRGVKK